MKRMKQILRGRYGIDQLNIILLSITVFLEIAALLFQEDDIKSLAGIFLLIAIYRILSKKQINRYKENAWVMKKIIPILKPLYIRKARTKDKEHKYCHCPSCQQTIWFEKQKEKVMISCPMCKTEFMK